MEWYLLCIAIYVVPCVLFGARRLMEKRQPARAPKPLTLRQIRKAEMRAWEGEFNALLGIKPKKQGPDVKAIRFEYKTPPARNGFVETARDGWAVRLEKESPPLRLYRVPGQDLIAMRLAHQKRIDELLIEWKAGEGVQ